MPTQSEIIAQAHAQIEGLMLTEETIISILFKWDGKVMRMERMRDVAIALYTAGQRKMRGI